MTLFNCNYPLKTYSLHKATSGALEMESSPQEFGGEAEFIPTAGRADVPSEQGSE